MVKGRSVDEPAYCTHLLNEGGPTWYRAHGDYKLEGIKRNLPLNPFRSYLELCRTI